MHGKTNPKVSLFSLILGASGLLALVAGCPEVLPTFPVADAGLDQNVDVGEQVELNGLGSYHPDGDPLAYIWEQTSGPNVELHNANSVVATFTPVEEGICEFALTVTDGRGGLDRDTVRIFVGPGGGTCCPWADAGTDQTAYEVNPVTLRGGNSADSCGLPLTYRWIQLSGTDVSINGQFIAEPSFATPQVTGADIELEFELTVTNEQGCSDTDTVIITVRDRDPDDPCHDVTCSDDGLFCNGVEACDDGDCVSSGDPCSSEETCDEENDECKESLCDADADCDDGDECTMDICDVDTGLCSYPPLVCDDEDACTDDSCVGGVCVSDAIDIDDDLFCTGIETCDPATGDITSSGDPCPEGIWCDEDADACVCNEDVDCDDGLFCNGEETCVDGSCVAGTDPCAYGETGLIAKWNLDGDAIDATGNGHNGVVHGATPAEDRLGNPAGAMAFDGNDYLSVPDDAAFTLGTGDFTIATWGTRTAFTADNGCYMIAHSNGPGHTNKWILWLGRSGISFVATQPGSHWESVGSYTFSLDEWNHVVIRRQGNTLTAFVDGSPIGSIPFSLSIPDPSQPLTIGSAEFDRPNRYLQGALDEVRFYDLALSDAEVQALFASGDDGSSPPPQDDTCDEENDECIEPPCYGDADCDDDDECTVDTCDVDTGECLNVELDCDDEDACTDDSCVGGACVNDPINIDDGLFCTGIETCDPATGDITSSGDPCPEGIWCDEDADTCDMFECTEDADCDDGQFCNGEETCTIVEGETEGICVAGTNPCQADEICDEEIDECIPSGEETDTIHSSEWLTGAIDPVVDQDAYTFTSEAGQLVFIQVNRMSDTLNPRIDLFPPSGGAVEAGAGDSYYDNHTIAVLFAHPLEESGQYTIVVRDDGADGTGGYVLSLLNLSGALTSEQDPDGGPIAFDEVKTGAIAPVADQDAYTFTGEAGQQVTIQANRMGGGLNPQIRLYPPNGGAVEAIAGDSYYNNHSIAHLYAHTLAESGQYTILVRDDGADDTGECMLSLNVLP